jgi:hypothetical protein
VSSEIPRTSFDIGLSLLFGDEAEEDILVVSACTANNFPTYRLPPGDDVLVVVDMDKRGISRLTMSSNEIPLVSGRKHAKVKEIMLMQAKKKN